MQDVIRIGNKDVTLDNNVAWTMEYRDQFGKDIVPSLVPLVASGIEAVSAIVAEASDGGEINAASLAGAIEGRAMEVMLPLFQVEAVDIIINVTWAMAKAADESIEPPKRWVRQFETFPLDEVLPKVYKLVVQGFVSSKNLDRLKKAGETLKNLQPSLSMISSSPDSKEA